MDIHQAGGPLHEFFNLFDEAGANVVRAAEVLDRLLGNWPDEEGLGREILICEQEGDRITHDVHQRLNSTFVTPIDREDVLKLVSDLDDIIDLIDEVADYLGLYKIEAPMEQAVEFTDVLVGAGEQIAQALRCLRNGSELGPHLVEIHRLENEGDRLQRDGVASLFAGGIDPMVVIRWKDIFESLEAAVDACETVAHVLEGITLKQRRRRG